MGRDGKPAALYSVGESRRRSSCARKAARSAVTSCAQAAPPTRLTGSAMFSSQAWEKIARSLNLSVRELQIIRGVFDDQKELTLAKALGISVHTIHTHVARLHRKLAVTDRSQLIQLVMQEFLVLTAAPGNGLQPICANRASGSCPLRL